MRRAILVKTILWALLGMGVAAIAARLWAGLGVSTNLSNSVSWGVWNAIKIGIVPLSAGGFVLAAIVYVFGLERFRPLLRLAILTGFLGYTTFSILLVFDIGVPYRIWHPMIFWQVHSVLFEVAWCVMLYLTVLALEFAPVALEHKAFQRPLFYGIANILKKVAILLVIAGIVLSTLHQSSLGSLFLITPHRLNALWYSPVIYALFFVTAVGMGFLVVVVEAFVLEWLFGVKAPTSLLTPLGRAGAVAMLAFFALRVVDHLMRGVFPGAFADTGMYLLIAIEALLAVVAPAALLAPRVARSRAGLFLCSLSAVMGVVLHRANVALLAIDWGRMSYIPSLMEIMLAVGILSGAALVLLFCVEHLRIYEGIGDAPARSGQGGASSAHSALAKWPAPSWLGWTRRYSLAAVVGMAAMVALLPRSVFSGLQPVPAPAQRPRLAPVVSLPRPDGGRGRITRLAGMVPDAPADARRSTTMLIDGNRDGRLVMYSHDRHVDIVGRRGGSGAGAQVEGEAAAAAATQAACAQCHHMNMPFDTNTSCSACHADLYQPVNIFAHDFHVGRMGGNQSCVECHAESNPVKNGETALSCVACHADMQVAQSLISQDANEFTGVAPGYMDAMHALCIGCHAEEAARRGDRGGGRRIDECATCHRDPALTDMTLAAPYVRAIVVQGAVK